MTVFLRYAGDMKTFPYGLPDPVSFDSNFIDKRSTLIILAVGRYLEPLFMFCHVFVLHRVNDPILYAN